MNKKILNVGILKNLINNIPDNTDIIVADDRFDHHCLRVSSVGFLECEYEPYPALGFTVSNIPIDEEVPDFCTKVLWPDKAESEEEND